MKKSFLLFTAITFILVGTSFTSSGNPDMAKLIASSCIKADNAEVEETQEIEIPEVEATKKVKAMSHREFNRRYKKRSNGTFRKNNRQGKSFRPTVRIRRSAY